MGGGIFGGFGGVGTGSGLDTPPDLIYKGGSPGGSGSGGLLANIAGALHYAADRNRCAANNALSVASDLKVSKDSFLGQSLLGNDAATISKLALGPNRQNSGLQAALSNPTPVNAITLTAKGLADSITVDTGRLAIAANNAGTYYATGSIVKPISGTIGAKALSGVASIVSAGKALYDAALYIDALIVCSQDPTLK